MLSNAYFLAKFRFGTAQNEPAKNLQNPAKKIANQPTAAAPAGDPAAAGASYGPGPAAEPYGPGAPAPAPRAGPKRRNPGGVEV